MMIRFALVTALVLTPVGRVSAQYERMDTRHSAAWFEFLGNGGVYSLNVETYVSESVVVRAGFARWKVDDFFWGSDDRYITAPATASYVRGSGNSKLETGLGLMFGHRREEFDNRSMTIVNATGIFGYRYEPADHRVIYRIVATPFLPLQGDYPDGSFLFSIGMSVGFQF